MLCVSGLSQHKAKADWPGQSRETTLYQLLARTELSTKYAVAVNIEIYRNKEI